MNSLAMLCFLIIYVFYSIIFQYLIYYSFYYNTSFYYISVNIIYLYIYIIYFVLSILLNFNILLHLQLKVFSRNPLNKDYCLAHLFTHQTFNTKNSVVLGLAYIASARSKSHGGICTDGHYYFLLFGMVHM